ncbi:hypothetical protein GLOIN_2v1718484, partial [Rhizophagus irregularis DAOM 181602=DAOM 197198]
MVRCQYVCCIFFSLTYIYIFFFSSFFSSLLNPPVFIFLLYCIFTIINENFPKKKKFIDILSLSYFISPFYYDI